ncbi:PorP/SprF family type IX secretion system membrane protein [Halosquirtibacter laminarini]|uniref:PorP/SprF family type IX secretion system membrane protein n=1 Tax=Halosquirtibacter laminarini TaxID=3374600 RepID=A0AC61NFD0_9BACT|nr:PorP/SprF family type IX secretion system membrane protein [Prolixibacteraceae bacterium]
MKYKKCHLLIIVLCLILSFFKEKRLCAQEQVRFNSMVDHFGLFNPSYTGKDTTVWVDVINTTQWSGFEGSPTTTTAHMHGHIQSIEAVDRGEDVKKALGFGFTIQSDKVGLRNNSTASIQLQSGIQIGDYSYLYLGVDGGSSLIRYDMGKMNSGEVIPEGENRNDYFVGAGVTLEAGNFIAGGAGRKVISKNTEINNMSYFGHAEYLAMLPSFSLKPVGFVQYDTNKQTIWDAGIFAGFVRDKIWIGGIYHSNNSFSAMLKVHALKFFKFSYIYTLNTGELQNFAKNSNEFNISIDLRNLWMKIFGIKHGVNLIDYFKDDQQKNSFINK